MTRWYLIETSVNFLQFFVIYKIFDLYYERRVQFKYIVESIILLMTVLLCILNYYFSINSNPVMYISFYIFIFIIAAFIFKGNIISKAGLLFLVLVFLGTCEFLASIVVSYVAGLDISMLEQQNFARFDAMVISQTLFLYSYIFMKKKISKKKIHILNNKYYLFLGLILFLTLMVMVIVIWMYGNINSIDESINSSFVLLTLCVSFISIMSIALIDIIIRDIEEKHKSEMELQHMKMEKIYYADVNSVLEEIRVLKHDMRGELAIIHGYNELNQKDKIRNYIEKKLNEMDIQLTPQIDDDKILTSFLNFKAKEAKVKDITVDIQNKIIDSEICIDKEDVCRILNNIMNNAIEACSECEEKYIKLILDTDGNNIIIKSGNPFKGELLAEGKKIITKKQDKTIHGYGLKSIENIAEKHNGFISIDYNNNEFNIEVYMTNINKYSFAQVNSK